ncbi:AAA family ATPase [Streptosporangium sp. NPDC023963]|uniref:AAA family ATPase n=1 Tax=Streptosporangium sp. NPDC023963 TaxID=3155608 RepID=UPI003443CA42
MRLSSLRIGAFKNLRDLYVEFDTSSPYTVLVGENGSGKSNLVEAIALIFRNLDLELPAPFTYELSYSCREFEVQVSAENGKSAVAKARQRGQGEFKRISKKTFLSEDDEGRPLYRPAFVFGYYSGPSDRLAELFEKHQERFYNRIIKDVSSTAGRGLRDANSLRRLFYAQNLHGQFALLAFFMENDAVADEDRAFLREHLQIDGLDSVLFALREPTWQRAKGGDPRFWHAEGEVKDFLGRLYDAALLPMRMPRRIQADLTKNPPVDSLYLFLPTQDALTQVFQTYPDQYSFFTALESTHLSKLLGEVRTRVRLTPAAGGGEVTYRDLSEGEQQLLLVLGLLKFTARDEALFLLDEPDTHLNPIWSTQYLSFLDRFIRLRNRGDSCHILMSSHDPLVLAGLDRPQVRIFTRGPSGTASVEVPDEDPRGMGVAAILTSDLFRLRSTLDPETQDELDRQRILSMKDLTDEERNELEAINNNLNGKGFSRTIRDPLYQLFVKAWTDQEDPSWRERIELTPEQIREREELSASIIRQLQAEGEI